MNQTTELPDAWKKSAPSVVPALNLPDCHMGDPAELAAWYGPFGWADHLRKVVLSNCEELVRADYAAREQPKPSEQRLNALAHTHTVYVEWLVKNLEGRVLYEAEVLKRGLGG